MRRFRCIALQGSSRGLLPPLLLFVFLITTSGIPALAADVSAACSSPVARVVSIQGSLELLRARQNEWSRVTRLDTPLCEGDKLRTGAFSRAALFIQPETLVRIDQNTSISVSQAAEETLVEFTQEDFVAASATAHTCGAGYFITRFPRKFRVNTPHLNAAVEGTEFLVAMRCESTELSVFEGKVLAASAGSNDFPSQSVVSGQTLTVGGTEPPAIKLQIKPADAVQWTLYYPPITPAGTKPTEDCRVVAQDNRVSCFIARAEQLLRAGRVDEAQANIGDAVAVAPYSSDAKALSSIISLVRNDKAEALRQAKEAVDATPTSAPAWLALSYAQQADFKLETALASAQRAAELTPSSALAHARVAELQLSLGWTREAEKSAGQAVAANPSESRAHMILGFVHLAQINVKEAREDFGRAIERDSTEPLSRLGLGLAIIREGKLVEGREQIEIAVALDPTNSLIRSYVGKAYYEENTKERDQLAGAQFGIAKQIDDKDPTPWFYEAILKQSQNGPLQSLGDLQMSSDLNDNRAVFRSRLLLDQDQATRQVSLARTYSELGFEQRAVSEAAKSLSADPANFSSHRFLSDTYSAIDRHEIARVSELLQAQLLQPLNMNPVATSAPFTDLYVLSSTGTTGSYLDDYSQLFERNGLRLTASGLAGELRTRSDEIIVSALTDKVAMSVGQYYYASDGFRANNDSTNKIYNAFVQFAPDEAVSFQAEYRKRQTNHGDITLNFDPSLYAPQDRFDIDQETTRLGFRITPSPSIRIIGSAINNRRAENQFLFFTSPDITLDGNFNGTSQELQAQYIRPGFNLIAGAGHAAEDRVISAAFDFTKVIGMACLPPDFPCSAISEKEVQQDNGYLYTNFGLSPDLTLTLGLSHGEFADGTTDLRKWNPKAGLQWTASEFVHLRGAAFSTLKRSLVVGQTIEPTQIAGFTQFFDDFNGTESNVYAAGLDLQFNRSLQASIEGMHRDLKLGPELFGFTLADAPSQRQSEDIVHATLNWTVRQDTIVTIGYLLNNFRWNDPTIPVEAITDLPVVVRTASVPVSLRLFPNQAVYGQFTGTYVSQELQRFVGAPSLSGRSEFVTVDVRAGYLLPRRTGAIGIEVKNLFNEHFFFQDDNYRTSEYRTPAFIPTRTAFLKVWLVF